MFDNGGGPPRVHSAVEGPDRARRYHPSHGQRSSASSTTLRGCRELRGQCPAAAQRRFVPRMGSAAVLQRVRCSYNSFSSTAISSTRTFPYRAYRFQWSGSPAHVAGRRRRAIAEVDGRLGQLERCDRSRVLARTRRCRADGAASRSTAAPGAGSRPDPARGRPALRSRTGARRAGASARQLAHGRSPTRHRPARRAGSPKGPRSARSNREPWDRFGVSPPMTMILRCLIPCCVTAASARWPDRDRAGHIDRRSRSVIGQATKTLSGGAGTSVPSRSGGAAASAGSAAAEHRLRPDRRPVDEPAAVHAARPGDAARRADVHQLLRLRLAVLPVALVDLHRQPPARHRRVQQRRARRWLSRLLRARRGAEHVRRRAAERRLSHGDDGQVPERLPRRPWRNGGCPGRRTFRRDGPSGTSAGRRIPSSTTRSTRTGRLHHTVTGRRTT